MILAPVEEKPKYRGILYDLKEELNVVMIIFMMITGGVYISKELFLLDALIVLFYFLIPIANLVFYFDRPTFDSLFKAPLKTYATVTSWMGFGGLVIGIVGVFLITLNVEIIDFVVQGVVIYMGMYGLVGGVYALTVIGILSDEPVQNRRLLVV